jgi:leishmanolysin
MSGISSGESQLSSLSLAFFEDMGWYKANYSMSEPFNYGRGEGCNWIQNPCSLANWGRYFCSDSASEGCNGHRTAGGHCTYVGWTNSLPIEFRYFTDPTIGGDSAWNDYCPVYEGYSNRYCHDSSQTFPVDAYGEVMGPNSYCWDLTGGDRVDGCFVTQCFLDASNNNIITLRMQIGGNWIKCPLTGGNVPVTVGGQAVTVICPKVEFFCSGSSSATNFTWDPTGNIPMNPSAPPVDRTIPTFPDTPIPPIPPFFHFWKNGAGCINYLSNYVLMTIGVLFVYFCSR